MWPLIHWGSEKISLGLIWFCFVLFYFILFYFILFYFCFYFVFVFVFSFVFCVFVFCVLFLCLVLGFVGLFEFPWLMAAFFLWQGEGHAWLWQQSPFISSQVLVLTPLCCCNWKVVFQQDSPFGHPASLHTRQSTTPFQKKFKKINLKKYI